MSNIKAVVFDIGNVLLEWHPETFYDAILPPGDRARMFAETGIEAANLAVDRGAPFRDTIYAEAARHPQWEAALRLWHDRWIDICAPAIAGSAALLRALRAKGIPVFSLTNFGAETLLLAEARYPFLTEFDRKFVSAHLGVLKPEPAIYQALEDGSGLSGAELLFTDDKPENVAAAAARGWRTHLFEHPQGWARRLVAEGLLTTTEAAI